MDVSMYVYPCMCANMHVNIRKTADDIEELECIRADISIYLCKVYVYICVYILCISVYLSFWLSIYVCVCACVRVCVCVRACVSHLERYATYAYERACEDLRLRGVLSGNGRKWDRL